jgi:hypothetical protein
LINVDNNSLRSAGRNRSFVLDPNFPSRLLNNNTQWVEINCITYLIREYSQRHLTFLSDRVLAIAGLEQRLAKAMRTESRFGIFENYLHQLLLWYPLHETDRADGTRVVSSSVPSWSWMAATGGVRFLIHRYNPDLAFNTEICFHKTRADTLTATGVGKFVNLPQSQAELQAVSHYEMTGFRDDPKRGLWFDTGEEVDTDHLYCVFILRLGPEIDGWYWVLLVVPTDNDGEYTRVGVGMISIEWVSTVRQDVRIV